MAHVEFGVIDPPGPVHSKGQLAQPAPQFRLPQLADAGKTFVVEGVAKGLPEPQVIL